MVQRNSQALNMPPFNLKTIDKGGPFMYLVESKQVGVSV